MTFSREEADRLLRVLEWVNTATLAGDEEKSVIKDIAMKLKVALKSNPDDDSFEFLVSKGGDS